MTDTSQEPVPYAADLINQAQQATTNEELDQIEAQAEGRVTVIEAVNKRREELAAGSQPASASPPAGTSDGAAVQEEPGGPGAPADIPPGTEIGESPGGGDGLPTPYGAPGDTAPGTDNPGSLTDPKGFFTADQVDPPIGPYPDPPIGPYPDPVPKTPPPPEVVYANVPNWQEKVNDASV